MRLRVHMCTWTENDILVWLWIASKISVRVTNTLSVRRLAWSVYFCAIPSSSPVQNELYLATTNFSPFVLELPLPNRKAEVKFHYLFWNFRSQIETRKPIVQNELSLATAHFFTVCFGTSVPKSKSGSLYSLFVWNFRSQITKGKLICHNLFWNKFSKSRASLVFETRLSNRREDAKMEIGFTIPYGSQKS